MERSKRKAPKGTKKKPELLLPVGNAEAFYAALDGGADAVYLGLKQFNARNRAKNFTIPQLLGLLDLAKKANVNVYITLNTVIKNKELPELLDTLYLLSQLPISALIIQDWGIYYLVKKLFPTLTVHASTQMGNHNSLGTKYSQQRNFERVILARELTRQEVVDINSRSQIELELFAHGALCYSFSGMCLFSSFLGGKSANRGLCKQPCRRAFTQDKNDKRFAFSLKDNQLIHYVPEMSRMGIASIKIEGRMKSADYVYRVAQAYRKVLDGKMSPAEAEVQLQYDMGRDKTSYFYGGNVKEAITERPATGLFMGKCVITSQGAVELNTDQALEVGNRIRVVPAKGTEQFTYKLSKVDQQADGKFLLWGDNQQVANGDELYLASLRTMPFSGKLPERKANIRLRMPEQDKRKALNGLSRAKKQLSPQVWVRIDSFQWLRKVRLDDPDFVLLNFTRKDWESLDFKAPFLKKFQRKLVIEFPRFIPEGQVQFYRDLAKKAHAFGFSHFSLSHMSQRLLVPKGGHFTVNEHVYSFNDAAVTHYQQNEQARYFFFPQENEFDNLLSSRHNEGIVPMYFYPSLFYSRMPVKIESGKPFADSMGDTFRKEVREGMTHVLPEAPVSLLQYKEKLWKKGYRRYLIDLSFETPSKNLLQKLLKRLRYSEQVQPSSPFNFKLGFE